MTRMMRWLLFAFLLNALFVAKAEASTIKAATCSSSDVQAAINSTQTGDIVVIPSGSCTWSTQVSNSGKGITLQGQTVCTGTPANSCADNTNISTAVVNSSSLNISGATTGIVRVTGITFLIGSSNSSNGGIFIGGPNFQVTYRYDHNHNVMSAGGVGIQSHSFGLIDHNVFDVVSGGTTHQIDIYGDQSTKGFQSWNLPLALGTNQAVYVEDNTFTVPVSYASDGMIDGYAGGRSVIRHNQFNNTAHGTHGTDSGNYRSFFSRENYLNTYTNNTSPCFTPNADTFRGGTGLIWGNTYNGACSYNAIKVQVFRAASVVLPISNWQHCDGTNWELGSTDPSTVAGQTNSTNGGVFWVAANRDTTTTTVTTAFFDNNPGGTYPGAPGAPCRDQPGRTHNQVFAPVYEWLNSPDPRFSTFDVLAGYLNEGLDFYTYTTSFNGTSGVGSGLLSARPATCTVAFSGVGGTSGVAYWATDTSTLYQCGPTANTWTVYYTPYTYPHPLTLSSGTAPAAPVNLQAIVH